MGTLIFGLCLLGIGVLAAAVIVKEVRAWGLKRRTWRRTMGQVIEEKVEEKNQGPDSYRYLIRVGDPSGGSVEFWETTGASRLELASRVEVMCDPADPRIAELANASNAVGGLVILGFFACLFLFFGVRVLLGALGAPPQ